MGRKRKHFVIPKVTFTGIADKGKSVGRDEEGRVVFVDRGVVPGDVADVFVTRKKKGFFLGKAQEIHERSADRVEPFCDHFGVCGGCKWQYLDYEAQLRHKQSVVENALFRIGKVEVDEIQPILGCASDKYYRNKLEFTFSCKRWLDEGDLNTDVSNEADVLGFHPPGSFDKVVDVEHCYLQEDPSNALRNGIREIAHEQQLSFYDVRQHKGFLRTLMMRITTLGDVLLLVAFGHENQKKQKAFLDAVLQRFPQITSLYYCINTKLNDTVTDLDMHLYHGNPKIEEALKEVKFLIGPKSFFQTNTRQAVNLYDVAVEFAGLTGTENVYDLYTGLGSIALYLARQCRQVVGIEEIEAAIEDAKGNAERNGIDNAIFYAGDVKDILTEEFANKHGKPDVLITDPPRAGMHPQVVEMLLKLETPRLVYVSCNPATQARDLNLLQEKYRVKKVRAVDMFPHTHHIETVALLELK